MTSELGGQILISGLAAELSSAFTRCDERVVGKLLKGPWEERYLHPVSQNPQVEEGSRLLINEYLTDHVKKIRRICDSKGWALDYMPVTFIGGTSALLRKEISAVFGEEAFIPEKPEIANALGFLRRMVAWEKEILLPIEHISE
jgi:plasmid segregation protein ParM